MSIKSKYTRQSLKKIEKITGAKLTLSRLIWAIRQSEEIRVLPATMCDIN